MAILVLIVALVPIVVVDIRRRIIPDMVVIPATATVVVLGATTGGGGWWRAPLGAVIVAGALLGPALVRPDGMGMGDVKLCALIGAAMGAMMGLGAVLVGLVAAAGWGILLAATRRVRPSSVELPMAPFLAAGVLVVILAPASLVDSAHGGPDRHAHRADASVRPAALGSGHGRRHASLAGIGVAHGPPGQGRGGPRSGATAP